MRPFFFNHSKSERNVRFSNGQKNGRSKPGCFIYVTDETVTSR